MQEYDFDSVYLKFFLNANADALSHMSSNLSALTLTLLNVSPACHISKVLLAHTHSDQIPQVWE